MTDYLLSHQLLPEALGRGELVAGLAWLPLILLWELSEWLPVKPSAPSAGTGLSSICLFPGGAHRSTSACTALEPFLPESFRNTSFWPEASRLQSRRPSRHRGRRGVWWGLPQGSGVKRDITDYVISLYGTLAS